MTITLPKVGQELDFTYPACQCSFSHVDLCQKPVTITSRETVVRLRVDPAGVLVAVGHLGSSQAVPVSDPADLDAAIQLLNQALHLCLHGEHAPGWQGRPNETWNEWSASAETFVRGLDPESNR